MPAPQRAPQRPHPPCNVPADLEPLHHLLAELPGGQWISPHAFDGPWSLVAVTSYDEPNWQLHACLQACPGFAPPPEMEPDVVSLHVVPAFIARMCAWHSVESEAEIDVDSYGAELWDQSPTAEQITTHLAELLTTTTSVGDLTWQQDEEDTWLSSQVPCTGESPDAQAYFIGHITANGRVLRWRVDYYPCVTDVPAEGVLTGTAATLDSAQQATFDAITRLLTDGAADSRG